MKGRTRLFKTLFMIVLTLTMGLAIVACGRNTDKADVAEAKEALAIDLKDNSNLNNVTGDLGLPTTGLKDVKVTWTSSNAAVVSTTGTVTRQDDDVTVTLTATLTKGDETDTKPFTVKVIKKETPAVTPEEALAALEVTGEDLNKDEAIYTTTKNVTLPTTSLGLSVNWESSNETALKTDGTVTRPAYGQPNARVILTAYVGSLDKEFIVDVLAEVDMPVAQVLQTADTQLLLPSNEVVENMSLPASITVEGVRGELYETTVTWASSHPQFISNTGVVVRPALGDEDAIVTLTATISYASETLDKEIVIRVLADAEPYEEFETFAEAQEWYLDEIGTATSERKYAKILDVSLIGRMEDGLMFVDSEGSVFFAYGSQSNAYNNAQTDQLYDVLGNLAYYFGVVQINGTGSASSRQPTILYEKEGEPVTATPEVVESLKERLPDTMPTLSVTNMMDMELLRLTAKVYIKSNTDDYGVFLLDTEYDGDFSDIDASGTSVPYTDEAVVVYYTSNKDALIPLDGLTVTIDVVLYGLRDDRLIYNVVFLGTIDDIDVHEMTDEQAVGAVKSSLESTTPTTIVSATTIDLPTELLGTTIVWESSDEEVIALDGTVTPVDDARVEVTLTAIITKGDETATATIKVMVGELPLLTVEEVLELESGEPLLVKGTVVGYSANNTLVLHDETGAIAVFVGGSTSEANANALKGAIGKVVIIEGSRTAHQGLEQVGNIVKVEVLTETPVTLKQDITDLAWTAEALKEHQNKLVSITNGVVTNVNVDSNGNVIVTIQIDGKTINIRWDSRVAITGGANVLATAEEGDLINVIDAPLGWHNNSPQIGYYVSGQVKLSPDPTLERFEVVFMDGEEVVDTIEVVEGRTILEFPTMTKEGFAFAGWFTDVELTEEWLVDDVVDEDITLYAKWNEVEVYKHFTFGNESQTGYGERVIEVEGISISTNRVQINRSGFAPHFESQILVFAPINTATTAYARFDFSGEEHEGLNKLSFNLGAWSYGGGSPSFNNILDLSNPRFVVEALDGTSWVVLKIVDLKTTLLFEEYATIVIDTEFGATEYRISYIAEDAASGNTTQAAAIDDLKLYRDKVVLAEPVDVTFDLNYDGSDEPTVVTIEQDDLVSQPSNPARAGFNFLGWALDGETDLFDFETPVTEDITLVALWGDPLELDIALVKTEDLGTWVKFVGVVTGFTDWNPSSNYRNNTYIQDATEAILLYRATMETLVVGDVYEVVGQLTHFNGLLQIAQGATYTLSDEEIEIPEPVEITDLTEIDITLQSQKVSFEAVVKSVNTNGQELVVTLGEEDITIRSNSNSPSNAINAHFLTAVEGQPVSVVGIYVGWFNGPQLVPYAVEEVVFGQLEDEVKLNLAKAAIEELLAGKTLNMGYQFPELEELQAVEVVSQVTDPAGAIVEGVLADVTEDTEVTLTLTLKSGAEELEVVVTFTVLFVDPEAPAEPVEVTAAYVGGTGNMTAGNNATTIGLDDSIFVVTSIERSPNPLHVGLNQAGQIRLYNAADSGNTLVISIADGYTITKVEFVFGSSVTSAKIMTGTDVQLEGELTSNSTISYDELNVDTFSIQNIGTKQIYILQIKITYIQS